MRLCDESSIYYENGPTGLPVVAITLTNLNVSYPPGGSGSNTSGYPGIEGEYDATGGLSAELGDALAAALEFDMRARAWPYATPLDTAVDEDYLILTDQLKGANGRKLNVSYVTALPDTTSYQYDETVYNAWCLTADTNTIPFTTSQPPSPLPQQSQTSPPKDDGDSEYGGGVMVEPASGGGGGEGGKNHALWL